MLGRLPQSLTINGIEKAIRTDFRVALTIFQAYADVELNDYEKTITMLDCLYVDQVESEYIQEYIDKAIAFLDGKLYEEPLSEEKSGRASKRVIDWEQDEQLIISAINKVAGKEIRALDYLHWWTFLGYFNEIGECLLTTVINIRRKRNTGKKLEKYEQEFYRNNKSMIDLKTRYTAEELAEIDYYNKLLGG